VLITKPSFISSLNNVGRKFIRTSPEMSWS